MNKHEALPTYEFMRITMTKAFSFSKSNFTFYVVNLLLHNRISNAMTILVE